jgi:acetyltransferase EpsM
MTKKLIIIGGYGNGTVAASTVEDINGVEKTWEIIGFMNDFQDEVNGYPVIGSITYETAQNFLDDPNVYFLYTLITPKFREGFLPKLLDLKIPENKFATIIHPTAVISKFAKLGKGVCIQPFVSVGPNVIIKNHVQIFAQALVGHDSTLENYSYVANNACIGAKVILEEGAYLGTNCSTLENISIKKWGFVGMGSVVIKNVPEYTKVVGNPAREIGTIE